MSNLILHGKYLKLDDNRNLILHRNIGAAIICRMGSSRLPGKTLALIKGKPLLQYIIDRLTTNAPFLKISLVTSTDKTDDPIELYGSSQGIRVIRGSLDNVAARFYNALREMRCDAVFRVNGDSPFTPAPLFGLAVRQMFEGDWDLITNINPRSFPPGMSIELIRTKAYLGIDVPLLDPSEQEHVTQHIYRHPERFKILNISRPENYSDISMAIDTRADLQIFERILSSMSHPHWDYSIEELISLRRSCSG